MVTFRFYLVSVVAFFLALAVGVVVGSVLDGRIADSLQDRLDRVETSLDETVAAMDEKNREIDDLERFAEAVAPFAVDDELSDTTSLVVVEPGVDAAPVEDLVARLRQSGSRVDGIVWLEPTWHEAEGDELKALTALAGSTGSTPSAVRRSFWAALFDTPSDTPSGSGEGTGDDGTTTTVSEPLGGDTGASLGSPALDLFTSGLLAEAEAAGFVRLQRIDGTVPDGGGDLVVVAVTGTDSTARPAAAPSIEVAESAAAAGMAATVADVHVVDPEVERGALVDGRLSDGSLTFSTVDDLDMVAGRVAVVLALSQARDGTFGRYGYGPDVDGVLPAWQGP